MIVRFQRIAVFLIICLSESLGQTVPSAARLHESTSQAVDNLKKEYPGVEVTVNPQTGVPSSIVGLDAKAKTKAPFSNPVDAVTTVLDDPSVKSLFAGALDEKIQAKLKKMESHIDPALPGTTIVTYRQEIGGIPVYGSTSKFFVSPSASIDADLNLASATKDVVTRRAVSDTFAQERAKGYYVELLKSNPQLQAAESALFGNAPEPQKPELVMYDPTKSGEKTAPGLRSCWIVQVGGIVFFIDANSGDLLHKFWSVHSASTLQVNKSSSPVLNEAHQVDPPPGAGPSEEALKEAGDALENAKKVRAFFASINRNFFDACSCNSHIVQPPELVLNIDFPITNNSLWENSSRAAYFAPGFARGLDIVGHELTHGVTLFASCLQNDSPDNGAVGEFFADWFAAAIRNKNGMSPWSIGDTLSQYAPPHQPLRSLENPHLDGFSPTARVSSQNRGQPEIMDEKVDPDRDTICSSNFDALSGCPHFNSGILNKAGFLATAGGNFKGETYTGIGFEKMTAIMSLSLTALNETMDFQQTATLITAICQKLQEEHADNLTPPDCSNVSKAFKAVGVLQ